MWLMEFEKLCKVFVEINNNFVYMGVVWKLSVWVVYNVKYGFEVEFNVCVIKMFVVVVVIFVVFMFFN